jgi:hypothetical protein
LILKALVVGAVFAGLGVAAYFLVQRLQPLSLTGIAALPSQAWNTWTSLPGGIQTIIVGVIGGGISVFMMWTKMRAMTALQQTKVKAAQQYSEMQGTIQEQKQQIQYASTKGMEGLMQEKNDAVANLAESQTLVTQYKTQLEQQQRQFNAERTAYQNTIADLKMREKTVVA